MNKLREMREKILSKKDNKGFTLVELIVVIVILAILVGVTIGGVYGYVNKSRVNTDINNASAITSTLSTLTTVKDFSGSDYKKSGGFAGEITVTWDKSSTVAEVIKGKDDIGNTLKLSTKISELLPEGFPAPKTAGAGFELKMTWDDDGNFQSVKCTAKENGGSGSALEAQE